MVVGMEVVRVFNNLGCSSLTLDTATPHCMSNLPRTEINLNLCYDTVPQRPSHLGADWLAFDP